VNALGTPRFSAARFQKREKLQSGSRGRKNHLPRDNTREHRGVSASSFREGAILRELGTPWERRALVRHVFKKEKNYRADRGVVKTTYPAITHESIAA